MLVHLRKGEPLATLAAGFGVSATTAWRYVRETTGLPAVLLGKAQAPRDDPPGRGRPRRGAAVGLGGPARSGAQREGGQDLLRVLAIRSSIRERFLNGSRLRR